ncbi:MAG TPA: hypothetical protein VFP72_03965, partial [Kineosporiaceae bacterium]|nr:hypothetical protein [Kineosporiaceae bacterium]
MACPWTPTDCAGSVVSGIANSAVDGLVQSIGNAVVGMLKTVSTFWLDVPSGQVATSRPSELFGPVTESHAVQLTRLNLEWLVVLMVAVGLIVAMARMAITARVSELVNLGRMYLILTLVTGISTIVVTGLLTAGDEMAPWFIQQAMQDGFANRTNTLITAELLAGTGQGAGLVLGLLALLASLLQIVAMLIRGAFIVMLMGVLPVLAADTTSESGFLRFKRAIGWLTACIIYKPVAAVIYAVGFMTLRGEPANPSGGSQLAPATGDQMVQSLYGVITGLIIIVLAVVALPALMRFIAPVASQAGGGPGVAAAVGAVASGAAVV